MDDFLNLTDRLRDHLPEEGSSAYSGVPVNPYTSDATQHLGEASTVLQLRVRDWLDEFPEISAAGAAKILQDLAEASAMPVQEFLKIALEVAEAIRGSGQPSVEDGLATVYSQAVAVWERDYPGFRLPMTLGEFLQGARQWGS